MPLVACVLDYVLDRAAPFVVSELTAAAFVALKFAAHGGDPVLGQLHQGIVSDRGFLNLDLVGIKRALAKSAIAHKSCAAKIDSTVVILKMTEKVLGRAGFPLDLTTKRGYTFVHKRDEIGSKRPVVSSSRRHVVMACCTSTIHFLR